MYRPFSGVLNLAAQPDQILKNLEEVRLVADVTAGVATVNLPEIASFGGNLNVKIWVTDGSGNAATFPITINANAADTINDAASFVINNDDGTVMLTISDKNAWEAVGSVAADDAVIKVATLELDQATIQSLSTTGAELIPAPPAGSAIEFISGSAIYTFDGVAFAGANGNLFLLVDGAIVTTASVDIVDAAASQAAQFSKTIAAVDDTNIIDGAALRLSAANDFTDGGANATILVNVLYRLIPTA